ncbi:hypothetical protein [Paractinoplanes ferrugineus]|uniref:hypothetical protein n=1 Tax=Paractinoplanes ferrugineus TaxID=113564 RepID=UPI0019415840|nr:hypothetical protein [Actinoplanes ferrugineus]
MTGPEVGGLLRQGKRRRLLIGAVIAWIVVLVGLSIWSVEREPATVPEQRDIAHAVPELQQAAGTLFTAADGDGRALVLGELELIGDCRITPVRSGTEAARDLTIYVADGGAKAALDQIAAGLPKRYQAYSISTKGGTRLTFHADAGNFIGIDGRVDATAKVLTLRLTSGCRPDSDDIPGEADPSAGAPPAVFGAVLAALSGEATSVPATTAVPGATSWTVALDEPTDLQERLRKVSAGAAVIRGDASVWAYRTGDDSVVVVPDGKRVRVTVSQ